jgi:MYXO-CTERM domain-containing protein
MHHVGCSKWYELGNNHCREVRGGALTGYQIQFSSGGEIMIRAKKWFCGVLAGLGAISLTSAARATFHEWRIDEVYSNPSGSIQFIEFQLPSAGIDDEMFVGGQTITDGVNGKTFTIPSNLPAVPVVNEHFLVASPGYAALSGVPAADYILPSNNFFSTSGDTLSYSFVDSLTFTSAQLDADGTQSLNRTSYGSATFDTAVNSPTNFAGQTGTVQVPEPTMLGLAALLAVPMLRRRRI